MNTAPFNALRFDAAPARVAAPTPAPPRRGPDPRRSTSHRRGPDPLKSTSKRS